MKFLEKFKKKKIAKKLNVIISLKVLKKVLINLKVN